MKNDTLKLNNAPQRIAWVSAVCGLFLLFCAACAGSAQASLEQVKTFGDENVQLFRESGTAVNTTGAGGVPKGTVYMVAELSPSVARYSPQGEFREAWGWGVAEGGKGEYQRCGPDGEASHPTCAPVSDDANAGGAIPGLGEEGENLGQLWIPTGIAVDQETGNVYVFNKGREQGIVQVFSADGSQRLGGFGEAGDPGKFPEPAKSIEEEPEKLHVSGSYYGSALTVGESGNVYIPDADFAEASGAPQSRVMVFEPDTPGDYGHYVYAGQSQDIKSQGVGPIASDYVGHIYVATDNSIYEYAPPNSTPVCKFEFLAGGIYGMTADPATGEVYYYDYKKRNFHRLVCNAEGKFVDTESFAPTPKDDFFKGLAFNPVSSFDGDRPAGILYAVNPETFVPNSSAPDKRLVGVAYVFAPGAVLSPIVESQTASEVGINSAALHAVVNPNGAVARYVFQYISDEAYQANEPGERFAGASELPLGGGELQSAAAGVRVADIASGLQAGAQYHFRVVAENCTGGQEPGLCTTAGEEETFRTFPAGAGGMPDHRAYELVSPAQKYGGQVYPAWTSGISPSCLECKPGVIGARSPSLSSPDGERVVYAGDPFSFTEAAPNTDAYMSVRTASGWQTTTLSPLLGGAVDLGIFGYDRTLSKGVLLQRQPSLTANAPSEVPNLYTLPTANPGALSPILAEEPTNTGRNVQLKYVGASSDLSHIFFTANDALTQETSSAPAAEFLPNQENLYEYFEGQTRLVNVLPGNAGTVVGATFGSAAGLPDVGVFSHAVSEDGSRAFWSDPKGQVYVREDGASTRELSDHVGRFLTADADASKVLLSNGNLIDLKNEESAVDLTQGQGGFLGIAGQSDDLSHIYFVDTAVLDEGPNSQGESATAGGKNLYDWDEGVVSFIANLTGEGENPDNVSWKAAPVARYAGASPNGEWLAFTSSAPLMGNDKSGPCGFRNAPVSFPEVPCPEVFLYDAENGELSCPSCTPTEEAPLGLSHLPRLPSLIASAASLPQQRYITDSGRLFFDSPNRLSPSDTNDGAEDVYEYEPKGVGTCDEEGGCVSLLSAGDEFSDSNLLFIDPSGKNAFFTTREQLSLRDRDELIDLYDAREDGGLAAESETIRMECQGEACQAPVLVPNDPTPSSSTFQGAGNVREKATKKAKKHKKHHKKQKKHHKKQKSNSNHNRGGAK